MKYYKLSGLAFVTLIILLQVDHFGFNEKSLNLKKFIFLYKKGQNLFVIVLHE
jgi:hypothetical protein